MFRWQKLGISVKGNSATAILNCEQQDTKAIKRNKDNLKTDGIIIYGQEIDDKGYFDVSFQQKINYIKKVNLIILNATKIVSIDQDNMKKKRVKYS